MNNKNKSIIYKTIFIIYLEIIKNSSKFASSFSKP